MQKCINYQCLVGLGIALIVVESTGIAVKPIEGEPKSSQSGVLSFTFTARFKYDHLDSCQNSVSELWE